jgi:hypothetical protein
MLRLLFLLVASVLFQGVDSTPTPPPTPFPLSPTPVITPTMTPIPTLDPLAYPEKFDTSPYPTIVVTNLRALGLDLPKDGHTLFTLDNAFAKTSDPGFNLVSVGKGARAKNFVLNVIISWNQNGERSACGVVFRGNLAANNTTVLLGVDNIVAFRQYVGDSVPVSFQAASANYEPDKAAILTILALDDAVVIYVNGKRETAQRMVAPITKGSFWLTVYNPRDNLALTDCRFRNFWIWTFDPRE